MLSETIESQEPPQQGQIGDLTIVQQAVRAQDHEAEHGQAEADVGQPRADHEVERAGIHLRSRHGPGELDESCDDHRAGHRTGDAAAASDHEHGEGQQRVVDEEPLRGDRSREPDSQTRAQRHQTDRKEQRQHLMSGRVHSQGARGEVVFPGRPRQPPRAGRPVEAGDHQSERESGIGIGAAAHRRPGAEADPGPVTAGEVGPVDGDLVGGEQHRQRDDRSRDVTAG